MCTPGRYPSRSIARRRDRRCGRVPRDRGRRWRTAGSRSSGCRRCATPMAPTPLARRRQGPASAPGSPTRRRRRGARRRWQRRDLSRASATLISPNAGWTRLTTTAATPNPRVTSWSANQPASSMVSRRGEVTRTKRVESARRSDATASARSRKPASIPANAWKKAAASVRASEPTTRPIARNTGWLATDNILKPVRVGSISSLNTGWSRKSRQHAGSFEEVERVAAGRRVDHDQVEAQIEVQLVQRLGCHELLRAAQGIGHVPVEPVLHDARRLGLVGGVGANDALEHRRRVEHHRPQLAVDAVQLDRLRLAGQPALQAERVGQPPGRVDGDDDHPTPGARRRQADRGGDRRLADSSGPTADDDVGILEQGAQRGSPSTKVSMSSGVSAAVGNVPRTIRSSVIAAASRSSSAVWAAWRSVRNRAAATASST